MSTIEKTHRWTPEEDRRTLIESELAARDASNIVNRSKAKTFPVKNTMELFDGSASAIQPKVFDYSSRLESIRTPPNLAMIGHVDTGKSHTLIELRVATVHA